MGETQLVFEATELRWIVAQCPQCQTKITFDALTSSASGHIGCPGCNRPIEHLNTIVATYRAFFRELRDTLHVQFCVPLPK